MPTRKLLVLIAGCLALIVTAVAMQHFLPHLTAVGLAMSPVLGARFEALPGPVVEQGATPPSGGAEESIWHQAYDTQLFTSAATTRMTFFQTANADKTLSNMDNGGSFPRPQKLRIFNVCLDILVIVPVSTSATLTGALNDLALLMVGSGQRPVWTLSISQKAYGPYSLTTLGGTGGPVGIVGSGDATEIIEFAKNDPSGGWNYFGRVTIPEQVNFTTVIDYAATATLTGNALFRFSLFGVLNRRSL